MKRLKRWVVWIREHREDWPLFVSVVVGFLNTEFATPFIFRGIFGLNGNNLGIAAGTWASTELCWWNYFSGWFYKNKIRKLDAIDEVINLGQEAQKAKKEFDLREFLMPKKGDHYLVVRVKDFIRKHSIDNFDPDKYRNDSFFIKLVGALRVLGYLLACVLIFIMGLLPLWWIFALMVCRLLKWRLAYAALFISNFLKNYWLALLYDKIGFWWWISIFILLVIGMSYILKIIVKNIKHKQVNENHLDS